MFPIGFEWDVSWRSQTTDKPAQAWPSFCTMSSQNQATCETAPLLGDSRPAGRSDRSRSRERFRFSPETLLIPVVIATKLGNVIPSTTLFELLRQTVCRLSNISRRDPASLGPHPPQLCDAPEVVRDFATVIAILGAIGGIACVFVLLAVTATVAHKNPSNGWVWHLKSYFSALWEETRLLVHTHHGDHVELPDTRVTVYARRTG